MFAVFYAVKLCISVYLQLVPHPVVFVTYLWIHGVCVCVCVSRLEYIP